jgi:hypothetical protein
MAFGRVGRVMTTSVSRLPRDIVLPPDNPRVPPVAPAAPDSARRRRRIERRWRASTPSRRPSTARRARGRPGPPGAPTGRRGARLGPSAVGEMTRDRQQQRIPACVSLTTMPDIPTGRPASSPRPNRKLPTGRTGTFTGEVEGDDRECQARPPHRHLRDDLGCVRTPLGLGGSIFDAAGVGCRDRRGVIDGGPDRSHDRLPASPRKRTSTRHRHGEWDRRIPVAALSPAMAMPR